MRPANLKAYAYPGVVLTPMEAARVAQALRTARLVLARLAIRQPVETYLSALATLEEFERVHCEAHGMESRRRAPWLDFAGNPIHEGDTLRHPDGATGVVKYVATGPSGQAARDDSNKWFVVYGPEAMRSGPWSRLVLQVGDKGRAVVVPKE